MKIVVIEPLGVEKEQLLSIAEEKLPKSAELVCYDTRVTDTEILIERGRDADVVVVANLPLNGQVIRGFEKLKLLSVAFTGVDHGCGRFGVWHAAFPLPEHSCLQ